MAEEKHDIQDTGQLVARADRLVGELRQTMDRVAQSASDEGPQVQLEEWSPPSEETPAAEDAPPTDDEDPIDTEESESDVLEEPETTPVPEASVTPETPAEPEDLAEPEAPAEPEPSESATPEMDVSETVEPAESDEPTAHTEPPAEDEPESAEQPSIVVSTGESEQPTLPPDEAVSGNEMDAVVNSDEDSADSESELEVVDATNEREGEPEMVMVEDKEEAPSVESELFVDATAEAGDTAEARERVRSLDSELARLADSMIEGEVDDEHSVLVDDGDDPPSDEAGTESADAVPAEAPEGAVASMSAPPRLDPVADDPGEGVLYHLRRAAAAAWRLLERFLPTLAGELGPTAHVVCQCASGPVNKRPPVVRRAVGFVAIVTAMYVATVLVYVAVLRKPPTIDAKNTGMSLVPGSDEVVAGRPDD